MKEETRLRLLGGFETGIDLILVNLLWAVCCIPVVTIGASTAALHYVTRKIIMEEEYKVVRSFFHGFRENWKQGTALWLVLLVLSAVFAGDLFACTRLNGWLRMVCLVISVLTGLITLALETAAYPMLVRFQSSFSQLLKNALLLSMAKPLAVLANGAALAVLPVLAVFWEQFRFYLIPAVLLTGGILPALTAEYLLRRTLSRLAKAEDETQNGQQAPE